MTEFCAARFAQQLYAVRGYGGAGVAVVLSLLFGGRVIAAAKLRIAQRRNQGKVAADTPATLALPSLMTKYQRYEDWEKEFMTPARKESFALMREEAVMRCMEHHEAAAGLLSDPTIIQRRSDQNLVEAAMYDIFSQLSAPIYYLIVSLLMRYGTNKAYFLQIALLSDLEFFETLVLASIKIGVTLVMATAIFFVLKQMCPNVNFGHVFRRIFWTSFSFC